MDEIRSAPRSLLDFFQPDRRIFFAIATYGAFVSVLSLAIPISIQSIVNTVAFGRFVESLFTLTVILALALIVSQILRAFQTWLIEVLQRRLLIRVAAHITNHPFNRPDAHENQRAREEIANQFMEIFSIKKSLTSALVTLLDSLLLALSGCILLAFYHPWLFALDIVFICVCFLVLIPLGRHGVSSAAAESKSKYKLQAWVERLAKVQHHDLLHGAHDAIKIIGNEKIHSYIKNRQSHFRVVFRQIKWTLFGSVLMNLSILTVGGTLVINNQLSLGQLVAAEVIVNMMAVALVKIGSKLETFFDALISVQKLEECLFHMSDEESFSKGYTQVTNIESVNFFTNGTTLLELREKEVCIADGLLPHQEQELTRAFHGFHLRRNRIHLNRSDLLDLSPVDLSMRICILEQPFVWTGTIMAAFETIKPDIEENLIWTLLKSVELDDAVRKFEKGLRTSLYASQQRLTVSQRCQLSLALALAREPCVLVSNRFFEQIPFPLRERILPRLLESPTHIWLIITDEPDIVRHGSLVGPHLQTWCQGDAS